MSEFSKYIPISVKSKNFLCKKNISKLQQIKFSCQKFGFTACDNSQNKTLMLEVQNLKKDLERSKSDLNEAERLQIKAEEEKLELDRYIKYKKDKKRSS